ncbi:uncharacterized protein LOC131234357 [Magnolia sinica]|uniref:uncharacterized protein LOC131234357 n=1 Tax=Magnolia sinica TaxID=86752 RepID=UPI00265B274C|nr:uncharacterized protein LOC131234357 [Magnolia sinica]
MTGSTRFDFASSSPEGSAFASTYPNGQRGSYSGASLDRSGSFRESVENRARTSGSSTSRGGTITVEMPPLSQSLTLEQFSLGDQKFSCQGELRRIVGISPRIAPGDHAVGATLSKPLPPVMSDELRRLKANLQDTYIRARDRTKMLNESIAKLDKHRQTVLSKKRQRNEVASSERSSAANLSKTGQVHQNSSDLVPQRMDDRTKNAVPNRRVRTSVAEVRSEGRSAAFSRQGVGVDKDRDMLRAGNGGSVQVEDKIRGLPAGGDGWDKKMKRKRSVGTVGTRTIDGDVEVKQRMQPRLNNESLSRSSDGDRDLKRFRTGYSNGIIGNTKSDGNSLPNSSSARTAPRNDLDNLPLPNRAVGLDKERVNSKGSNKLNLREDNQAGSPGAVTKGKASRAPRTGSGVLVGPSPNFPRTSGTLDGWEQPPCSNKFQPTSTANNRKRAVPTESPLPSVAEWAGQRPPKNSRTKRMNIVSPVSNHEEPQVSPEGFPASDIGARSTSTETNGPVLAKGVSNDSLQFKTKLENVQSPAGLLSESEESGACENKSKVKGIDNSEMEEGAVNGNAVQKVAAFVLPKKNKIPIKDEIGDSVRRQGRSGRGSTPSRPSTPLTGEKLENTAPTKPLRGTKPGPDKIEGKSGRPPTKKFSDRKAFCRPGKVVNPGSSEFTGESDDDHEELLAAASSARNANHHACCGFFWKKMEPIFSCATSEDMAYLKQQISFAEELDGNLCDLFDADPSLTVECACKPVATSQALSFGERQGSQPNGTGPNSYARNVSSMNRSRDVGTLHGRLETERWFEKIIPLSQRLLQAFIVEDETEEFSLNGERRDACFQYSSDDSPCGPCNHIDNEAIGDRMESKIDSEADLETRKHRNTDKFSCNGSAASNNFMSTNSCDVYNDEVWQEDDALGHSEVGQNNLNGLQPTRTNSSGISSFECQYQQMSLDERILAELHSIGLSPDMVPDLTEGEDEDIDKDISELQEGLCQQVTRKKGHLCELEKTVRNGREMEEREREKFAMNKLVEMAYKKHMACRSSNKGGVSKISKQAASAFVFRTLARCQKFEDTGRSCFSELALRDVVFSPPLDTSDSKFVDRSGVGADVNLHGEDRNSQPQFRASAAVALSSGAITCTVERHALITDKPDGIQDHSNTVDPTAKLELMPNRVKKREILLDSVGVSVSRAASALVNPLSNGAKGKRSERERDQGKDASTRSSVAKSGRPSLGNLKGERKTKTKPKQKTAQLPTSGNGLLGRSTDTANAASPYVQDPFEMATNGSSKVNGEVGPQDPSMEMEEPLDFSKLQLPGMDMIEELGAPDALGAQGQDFGSWFNFDVDLQDNDLIGLPIPMDDLSTI